MFGRKQREQRERILTFKKVFGGPDGKEILYDLMNRYHLLNSHKGDAYSEGQRSVVLYILSQTNINMEAFDKLLKGEIE